MQIPGLWSRCEYFMKVIRRMAIMEAASVLYLMILTFQNHPSLAQNHLECATSEPTTKAEAGIQPRIVGNSRKAKYAPFQVLLLVYTGWFF